ncbi:MAG: ABC transporter substrate-binding protein [Caldimonas sp.]
MKQLLKFLGRAALCFAVAAGAALPAAAQQRGGTLNMIVNPEPPTLMLGLNQLSGVQMIGGKIYQGLLTYDSNLNPQPGLAKSWTVSDDGLTYTFKLQDGVKWHDGKPFTSADVVFTTTKFLPEVHSRARNNFGHVASVTAPDASTVVFKMKETFAPFLGSFEVSSAPMVPRHIYEGTDFKTNPANQTPIGTGPFKLKEWKKGAYIHLVRNDSYWKPGLPYLDDIYFQVIPDSASRAVALESGKVDVSSFSDIELFDVNRFKSNPAFEVTNKGYEFLSPLAWIEFNDRNKPMSDKRFRQAVMYALDRGFIRDKIWFGHAKVATGPVSSATRFYEPDVKQYSLDLKKADALLDEMGLVKDKDGVRATIKLLGLPYGETWNRLNEYVRQSLSKVGLRVVIESTDAAGWTQRLANWDFEMLVSYLTQYGDPALGVARTYISSNIKKGVPYTNTSGYSNPRVDQLFAEGASAVKDDDRRRFYSEVQKILVEDVPLAWLIEIKFPTIYNKRVHNLVTTGIGVNESFDIVYLTK